MQPLPPVHGGIAQQPIENGVAAGHENGHVQGLVDVHGQHDDYVLVRQEALQGAESLDLAGVPDELAAPVVLDEPGHAVATVGVHLREAPGEHVHGGLHVVHLPHVLLRHQPLALVYALVEMEGEPLEHVLHIGDHAAGSPRHVHLPGLYGHSAPAVLPVPVALGVVGLLIHLAGGEHAGIHAQRLEDPVFDEALPALAGDHLRDGSNGGVNGVVVLGHRAEGGVGLEVA